MRTHRTRVVAVVALAALLSVPALAADLVVLVDPDSDEAAQLRALGFTTAGSMEELILLAGEEPCIVGLAYSGLAAADLTWFEDRLAQGTTLIGWGWDAIKLVAEEAGAPESVPGLITVGYVYDGFPISYPVDSPDELAEELRWACLYFDSTSLTGFGFDPSEVDLVAMFEAALPQIGPLLRLMDAFLQPQWEYLVVPVDGGDLAALLNGLGADGWELVTMTSGNLVLKRSALNGEAFFRLIFEFAQEALQQSGELPWP